MLKKLIFLCALVCMFGVTSAHAQEGYRRGLPGIGALAVRPPCGSSDDMYLADDTSALYSCHATVWTLVSGGSGGGGDYGLDCTPYVAGDLGATINACMTAAGSFNMVNISKLAVSQTLSTAVDDTTSDMIFTCGQAVTQTVAITLDSPGASLIGCEEQQSAFLKGGNLAAQVILNSSDNTVAHIEFIGGVSQGADTGAGVQLTAMAVEAKIERNFITFEDECISDLGAVITVTKDNHCDSWNVNGYAIAGEMTISDFISGGASSSGSAIAGTGSSEIFLTNAHIQDAGTVGAVTSSTTSGALQVEASSTIQQSNGYPAIIATGTDGFLQVTNSAITGGGAHGAVISQTGGTSSGFFVNISNNPNIQNTTAGADCIDVSGFNVTIENNGIICLFNASAMAAIHLSTTAAGAIISHNRINFQSGESPTGHNYGVWLDGSSAGVLQGNIVDGNVMIGQASVDDVGFHYTTTAGGSGDNHWASNVCGSIGANCFELTAAANEINYYESNYTVGGTLYSGLGSKERASDGIPLIFCGSTAACSNTLLLSERIIYGIVSLSSGGANLTGLPISTNVSCVGSDLTALNPVQITGGFTVIGTGSDVIQYICIGH